MTERSTALAKPQELSGRARRIMANRAPSPELHCGNLTLSLEDSERRRLLRKPTDPRSWEAFGRASDSARERLPRRPREAVLAQANAAGTCRSQMAAGSHSMDIDASTHRRRSALPTAREFRAIKRHDRHNDMKITRVQSEGDLQGRAFFDHTVEADRYAELLGRSGLGALETVDEEPGFVQIEEPLPTLLQRSRRVAPEVDSPKDYLPPALSATSPGLWRDAELQDSLQEVAKESAHFAKLLKEAQQALHLERFAGALAAETASSKARDLNEKLDSLEAKTAMLQQQAKLSLQRPLEAVTPDLSKKTRELQEAKDRRKGFNLVGKGPGWKVAPATSQV